MAKFKEILAVGAMSAAIGTGIGYWSEVEGNEDAKGRVITVDTCMKLYGNENKVVNKTIEDCLEDGVPGGEPLGNKVDNEDPIEFVGSARAHEVERAKFNAGRIGVYAVGTPIVVGGAILYFGN